MCSSDLTEVALDTARKVITRNDSPDIGFDRSINPYRGCEHGCVYCFARPTHAYMGLSPGLDFETKLFAKPDAPALAVNGDRKLGKRSRTRRLGGRRDRRVLEGMRGCSAHAWKIAWDENKSRTTRTKYSNPGEIDPAAKKRRPAAALSVTR